MMKHYCFCLSTVFLSVIFFHHTIFTASQTQPTSNERRYLSSSAPAISIAPLMVLPPASTPWNIPGTKNDDAITSKNSPEKGKLESVISSKANKQIVMQKQAKLLAFFKSNLQNISSQQLNELAGYAEENDEAYDELTKFIELESNTIHSCLTKTFKEYFKVMNNLEHMKALLKIKKNEKEADDDGIFPSEALPPSPILAYKLMQNNASKKIAGTPSEQFAQTMLQFMQQCLHQSANNAGSY